jgi:3-oxoacyl-[acyl-carrier protein] reductase
MRLFENRRVLVTGSGRGIGKAIARRFALGGAKVLLIARSRSELDESRAELLELTPEVHAIALDLALPDSARRLVDTASELWGGLDVLVTNAGAAAQGGFLELDDGAWPAGFGLKLFANLRVIRHAWPLLKQSTGHLVMIGGGTARTPDQRLSLVSAVNGGIAALSKSVAEQGIQDGVHVNLVHPGMVKTLRRRKLLEKWAARDGLSTEEYIRRTVLLLRVTRLGEPTDVAEVVAFLCSEDSRWIQGAIIDIDGGQNKGL